MIGDAKDKNFIQELLSARNKYEKIDLINIKELEKIENILIYDGILISDKLDISCQEIFNQILCIKKYDIQYFRVFEWCKSYLNRIPSEYVDDSSQFKKILLLRKVRYELFVKRLMDIFFSILILLITFPLILFSMLFIYLEDGGSVLYRQSRSGLNGKLIKIFKLRTMSIDAEVKGAQWAKKNDYRITKIGKILRKTRIDELPQLISVINGDMSLIGPRPERPEIERDQLHVLRNYNLRYLFKPGLSGWSQVNYPYGASVKDSDIKLSFDLFYLANFSLLLDLIIFFKTIKLVLNAQGSKPR
ncbi:MAG: sugar transferase [Prochlorococcus marinus CUG1437]|nr:sugar transferase [Prochlorococcus marinus CUG1437]